MRKAIADILEGKVWQSAVIETKDIVFSPDVVKACESNMCGSYNKRWSCPPAVGTLEECKARVTAFKFMYVYTTKHDLEDSYDYEGMMDGQREHGAISKVIRREIDKLKGNIKFLQAYGATCIECGECTYPDAPCRFEEEMTPAVEACGIDVVRLARDSGINYKNGENTVTYFSCILFNEK